MSEEEMIFEMEMRKRYQTPIDQRIYPTNNRIVPDCYVREAEALHSRNVRRIIARLCWWVLAVVVVCEIVWGKR